MDIDISQWEQGNFGIRELVRPDLKSEYETRYEYTQ